MWRIETTIKIRQAEQPDDSDKQLIAGYMKTKILLSFIFLSLGLAGFSKVWIITNNNNTFTPSTITINVGDTVNFAITSYHNAQEVSDRTWADNGNTLLAGGFEVPFGGGMVLPEKLGVGKHYFVCKPHASLGMKGTITVQGITAISENQLLSEISIYPNPTNGLINVKIGKNIPGATYTIADQSGRQVLNGKLTSETTTMDISQLANGFYFLTLGDEQKQTFKIIKK